MRSSHEEYAPASKSCGDAADPSRRVSYILNRVRMGLAEGGGQPRQARSLVRRGGDGVQRPGGPRRPGSASLRHRAAVVAARPCGGHGRVLIVAYTQRRRADEEGIRIISARRASGKERAAYTAPRD